MRNFPFAFVLLVLACNLPLIAAEPVPVATPERPAACDPSATSVALDWEIFDFEAELEKQTSSNSQTCDPNRQCTTQADCGTFGYCAVWRLCICFG